MKRDDHQWSSNLIDEAGEWWMKLEYDGWSSSFMDEAWTSWVKLEYDRWSWSMIDEAGVWSMKLEYDRWSLNIMGDTRTWSMKLEYLQWSWRMLDEAGGCGWSSSFMDEAGDGLYSVMSRSRFRRVYRLAMYSRQCAWSYGSGGVSKARGIYTCGCTNTRIRVAEHIWLVYIMMNELG